MASNPDFVAFKASKVLRDRLDELASGRGLNRSAAIKAAILEATQRPGGPNVPDDDEVLELLGEAARGGNVAAMKELRVYHRERSRNDEQEESDPFAAADELAVRRAAA